MLSENLAQGRNAPISDLEVAGLTEPSPSLVIHTTDAEDCGHLDNTFTVRLQYAADLFDCPSSVAFAEMLEHAVRKDDVHGTCSKRQEPSVANHKLDIQSELSS